MKSFESNCFSCDFPMLWFNETGAFFIPFQQGDPREDLKIKMWETTQFFTFVEVNISKSSESKKCKERNNLCPVNRLLYQEKQGIILSELAFWNRREVDETTKKRKSFLFNPSIDCKSIDWFLYEGKRDTILVKAAIPSLLVTASFLERKWKPYQVEIRIWYQNISVLRLYVNPVFVVCPRHAPHGVLKHYGYIRTWTCKGKVNTQHILINTQFSTYFSTWMLSIYLKQDRDNIASNFSEETINNSFIKSDMMKLVY